MVMDFQTAVQIFDAINSSQLKNLKEDLISLAIDYARIRTDYYLLDQSERREKENSRTLAHNAFIDSCNILSRNMLKNGESAEWRVLLGEERKYIGDFACYIHLLLGLKVR